MSNGAVVYGCTKHDKRKGDSKVSVTARICMALASWEFHGEATSLWSYRLMLDWSTLMCVWRSTLSGVVSNRIS